jgi:hypothetical protein
MSTKVTLLPGEQVVMSSEKNILMLTTKRVRFDSEQVGSSSFVSITLDSVASCGVVTRSYPILLVLAALAFIGGLTRASDSPMALIGAAAILVIIYFATRRAIISIASNGGDAIQAPANGMKRSSLIEFLDAVESEKLKCGDASR